MERTVRVFASHADAAEADRAAVSALTPQERLDHALELQARYRETFGEAGQGLTRVARIIPLPRR